MNLPHVAIVGRPNVGKSSLFNWLAGRRISITDATAGVTRDRLTYVVEHDGRAFELIDTGGMGIQDPDKLDDQIQSQIQAGIDAAQLILFVVDTLDGPLPLDLQVLEKLRSSKVPVLLVANKSDSEKIETMADEFYQFGMKDPIKVSVKAKRGKENLLDAIVEHLPEWGDVEEMPDEPTMKVAIVGRRNVGKSTLINTLAQTERMIVSEVAGTTRDSVDVQFELDGKAFIAIDTPGLRQKKSIKDNIDYYGLHRAQRSIRRADVVFLVFDAQEEIGRVEKRLASYIIENNKPCIFVVNKWDTLAKQIATQQWAGYLRDTFPTMWFVPIAFITGQTGRNVKTLVNHGQQLFKQARSRVGTPALNKLIRKAMDHTPPPRIHHRRPKIFYATQVDEQPPTIVLFCSDPGAFPASYRRYLLGVLHDQLEFGEVPIRMFFRHRVRRDAPDPYAKKVRTEANELEPEEVDWIEAPEDWE
ncbi:GTP-binding protein EngA [Planctomycetales bacterium 10988]|nr:GTP-binding protein EngA [Planctomycetales bacterium 10988]